MTIVEQFEAVKAFLVENEAPAEMVEFVKARQDAQAKRNENRKPSKVQVANEGLKVKMLEILAEADAPMTATEILGADVEAFGTVQKVSALLKALVDAKKVVKTVDKRKTYFALAE